MYSTYIGTGEVTIYDKFGNVFYRYIPKNNEPFFFNLSLQKFTYGGSVKKAKQKLIYKVQLPNRTVSSPPIKVVFTSGGDKASFTRSTGVLTIDEKYKSQPFFLMAFMYFHEMGHLIYRTPKYSRGRDVDTEFNCDKFAAKMMLRRGYNPSQILAAMVFGLGEGKEQTIRYNRMVDFLNNVKTKLINGR